MQKPIVVVGSINLDLVASAPRIPAPGETLIGSGFETFSGGKGANQAVAAARLGAPAAIIGAVGSDSFGESLRLDLRAAGVNTDCVEVVPGSSGTALISRSGHGENSIIVVPAANSALRPDHIKNHSRILAGAGMILIQLEIPIDTVEYTVRKAVELGVPVMLDPAPALNLPRALIEQITWLTPNESEQFILLNENVVEPPKAARLLLARGPKNVALKLGEQGVYLAGADCKEQLIPGFPVKAVDTTAAGDVFNAAFAVALVEGHSPCRAGRFAAAAAAIAVTRPGAQASCPTRKEVFGLLLKSDANGQ